MPPQGLHGDWIHPSLKYPSESPLLKGVPYDYKTGIETLFSAEGWKATLLKMPIDKGLGLDGISVLSFRPCTLYTGKHYLEGCLRKEERKG